MDIATIAGIIGGLFLLIQAIAMGGGQAGSFMDIPSVFITVGGTIAATLIAFSTHELKTLPGVMKKAFVFDTPPVSETIDLLVTLSEKARREGLLALEDDLVEIGDPFLRNGIQLVVDGTDPNMVRDVLETDLTYLEARHAKGRQILETMAASAPAFGMIGTLVGLIKMLKTLNDPSTIGPGMATALLTTLYGAVMAYLLFGPMARKLALNSKKEIQVREMMLEGILSIQAGENPRIVQEKLKSFLPPGSRASADTGSAEGPGLRQARA